MSGGPFATKVVMTAKKDTSRLRERPSPGNFARGSDLEGSGR